MNKTAITPIRKEKKIPAQHENTSLSLIASERFQSTPHLGFLQEFPVLCAQEEVVPTPEIVVIHGDTSVQQLAIPEKTSEYSVQGVRSSEEMENVVVQVSFDRADKREVIREVTIKGFTLRNEILRAVGRSLTLFSPTSTLRLEDCGLDGDRLQLLSELMRESNTLRDLNLDMNPISQQNFHCLLEEDSRLQHLSLRFCHIDDAGVRSLSECLEYRDTKGCSLISLNLNGNRITCKGAKFLSDALRTNRTLVSLSLAGNFIRDEGATRLADVLQRFALTHEEVKRRRRRNLAMLIKRKELLEHYILTMRPKSPTAIVEARSKIASARKKDKESRFEVKDRRKAISKDSRGGASSQQQQDQSVLLFSGKGFPSIPAAEHKKIEHLMEEGIEADDYPFLQDVKAEGGELWCQGNLSLSHLNLNYNRIGAPGISALLHALRYQEAVSERGMLYLMVQGNSVPDSCLDVGEILELAGRRSVRTLSSGKDVVSQRSGQMGQVRSATR